MPSSEGSGVGWMGKFRTRARATRRLEKISRMRSLFAASFDRGGMVVRDSEPSRGIGGSNGRRGRRERRTPSTFWPRRDSITVYGGHLRIFEMHCDGAVAPRIFQLMAAIRDVYELHAQFEGGFFKTSRLVTEFPGEEQQSFWMAWSCGGVSAPDYTKPSAVASTFFICGFAVPTETKLIPASVPRRQYQGSLR